MQVQLRMIVLGSGIAISVVACTKVQTYLHYNLEHSLGP